jgi:hypothetical protein
VEKRARTAAKAKATREANKAKKQKSQTTVAGESESDPGADDDSAEEQMESGPEEVDPPINKRQRLEN